MEESLSFWNRIWKKILFPIIKWGTFICSLLAIVFVFSWITLRINMSRKIVPVPNIIGMDMKKAESTLRQVNLKLKVSENRKFNETVPKDNVLLQSPAAGTNTKANSSVKVVLSNGTKIFSIPNLIGLSMRRSQIQLNTNNLDIGRVSFVYSEVDKDFVIAQEPPPGIEVMRDRRVNLLLSLGPQPQEFVMPDLVGKSYSEVMYFLEENGLRIGNIRRKSYPGVRPGIIIQQYPQAGYKVNKDSIINLWISQS